MNLSLCIFKHSSILCNLQVNQCTDDFRSVCKHFKIMKHSLQIQGKYTSQLYYSSKYYVCITQNDESLRDRCASFPLDHLKFQNQRSYKLYLQDLYLLKFQNQINNRLNNDELALKMIQAVTQNDGSLRNRCVVFLWTICTFCSFIIK